MRVSFRPIIGSVLARGWHGAVRHSSYGRGASTDRAVSDPIARQLKTLWFAHTSFFSHEPMKPRLISRASTTSSGGRGLLWARELWWETAT
jgi:hypothetical protein